MKAVVAIGKLLKNPTTAASQWRDTADYSFVRFQAEILRGNVTGSLPWRVLIAAYNTLFQEQ
jgi:hypothetical protein